MIDSMKFSCEHHDVTLVEWSKFNHVLYPHLDHIDNPDYLGIVLCRTLAAANGAMGKAWWLLCTEENMMVNHFVSRVTFESGASILFRHCENAEDACKRFCGLECNLISIQNIEQFETDELMYIMSRLRGTSYMPRPEIVATYAPGCAYDAIRSAMRLVGEK